MSTNATNEAFKARASALRLLQTHAYKDTAAMTRASSSNGDNNDDPRYGSGIQKVGVVALSLGGFLMQPWHESTTDRMQEVVAFGVGTLAARNCFLENSTLFKPDLTKQINVETIHQLITSPANISKVVDKVATVAESRRLFVNSSSMNSSVLATSVTEDDDTSIAISGDGALKALWNAHTNDTNLVIRNTSTTTDSQNFDEQDSETSHELLSLLHDKIVPLLQHVSEIYMIHSKWKGANEQRQRLSRDVSFYLAIYSLGMMIFGLNADYGLLKSHTMGPVIRAMYDRKRARMGKHVQDAADIINSIVPSYHNLFLAFAVVVAASDLYHRFGGNPFEQQKRRNPLQQQDTPNAADGHVARVRMVPAGQMIGPQVVETAGFCARQNTFCNEVKEYLINDSKESGPIIKSLQAMSLEDRRSAQAFIRDSVTQCERRSVNNCYRQNQLKIETNKILRATPS